MTTSVSMPSTDRSHAEGARLSRRRLLAAGALLPACRLSWSAAPAAGDARFVLVILRGGLDGLGAVPAPGDAAFAGARGTLATFAEPALPLAGPGSDGWFALHPALAQMHAMHGRGELSVLHAVGLPYRERSHFDAQQVLESGGTRPYEITTGWLARALTTGGTPSTVTEEAPTTGTPGTTDGTTIASSATDSNSATDSPTTDRKSVV